MEVPSTTGFQLSPQQRRLWTLQAAGLPMSAQVVVLLDGDLDEKRLRASLDKIVAKFEILRTSLQLSSGMKFPFQVVQSEGSVGSVLQAPIHRPAVGGPPVRVLIGKVMGKKQQHLLQLSLPGMCTDHEGLCLLAQHL